MINHVRTLLMNQGRAGSALATVGEEYTPLDFIPRALSTALTVGHHVLFGSNPDRLFMNYRIQQLMALMHTTELSQDILATDARVTYLPFTADFFNSAFKLELKHIAGTPPQVYVRGSHAADTSTGISQQLWDIEVLENDQVRVIKRRIPYQEEIVAVTYTAGLSTPIPLPGSQLVCQFSPALAGYRLHVHSSARPAMDVAELLNRFVAAIGARGISEIFPAGAAEPRATWYTIWRNHNTYAYRLTALMLAVAARIEQSPPEVNNG